MKRRIGVFNVSATRVLGGIAIGAVLWVTYGILKMILHDISVLIIVTILFGMLGRKGSEATKLWKK